MVAYVFATLFSNVFFRYEPGEGANITKLLHRIFRKREWYFFIVVSVLNKDWVLTMPRLKPDWSPTEARTSPDRASTVSRGLRNESRCQRLLLSICNSRSAFHRDLSYKNPNQKDQPENQDDQRRCCQIQGKWKMQTKNRGNESGHQAYDDSVAPLCWEQGGDGGRNNEKRKNSQHTSDSYRFNDHDPEAKIEEKIP